MALDYAQQTVVLKERGRALEGFNYSCLLGVIALVLGLAFYAWQGLQLSRLEYDIQESQRTLARLQQANSQLRVEEENLISPQTLAYRAKTELGLRAPQAGQVIIVDAEGY